MAQLRTLLAFLVFAALAAGWALFGPSSHHQKRLHSPGQPGVFDYYVLSLSWSPEFCHSHPESAECRSGHFGFVAHGLWPQYTDGYPENCSSKPGLSNPASMADIMPDQSLVAHEWATHGTCSGLDAEAYFRLLRQAFESVRVPATLSRPTRMFSITPQEIKQEFVGANPQFGEQNLAIRCGNNYLTGISVCLTKQLQPQACQGLRDCRANVVRVVPVR